MGVKGKIERGKGDSQGMDGGAWERRRAERKGYREKEKETGEKGPVLLV